MRADYFPTTRSGKEKPEMESKRRRDSESVLLLPPSEEEEECLRMDVDNVLEEVGQFGKYQIINLILLLFPIWYTAYFSISYVFTAGDLQYRCQIPECETVGSHIYNPPWLKYAIPERPDGTLDKCYRHNSTSNEFHSNCSSDIFLKNTKEKCNLFLFETRETTIASDFKLFCDENKWKLTFVGTINNIGQFIGLPIVGYLSDRVGRKSTLIAGTLLSAVMGVSRSFSPTYVTFLVFEFLDAIVSTGVYSGGFILGVELVGPEKRVLTSAIISSFYSVGEIIMGLEMWYFQNWRQSLRTLYAPGFFFIIYIWLIPESVRWLMTRRQNKKAVNILRKIASVNKKEFSDETRKTLDVLYNEDDANSKLGKQHLRSIIQLDHTKAGSDVIKSPLKEFIKSPRLVIRFINCSFCWITNTFVFYGLSLNSVAVAGNKYVNFILVSLAEIPGYFISWLIMDWIGRRASLFLALALSGGACIAFYFIPGDMVTVKLILFLIGKMAITVSFTVLYVYSAEMFPTNARHSLLGSCSMFGRIGSMIAPQTPLIEKYVSPLLLFGGIALTAGSLSLFYPETLHAKLPDNVKEAENISQKEKHAAIKKQIL